MSDPQTTKLPVASGRDTARFLTRTIGRTPLLPIAALLAIGAGTGAALVAPWLVGRLVDGVVAGDASVLVPVVIALVVAFAVGAALTWLGRVLLARLAQRTIRVVRESAFASAFAQPAARIEAAGTGDLISRLSTDVRAVGEVVSEALPALLSAGFGIALSLVGMSVLDPRLALAALAAAPIQIIALRVFLRRSAPVYRDHRAAVAERGQRTIEAVRGADTVAALQAETRHLTRIGDASEQAIGLEVRATHVRNVFFGNLNFAEFVGLTAVLLVGYLLVSSGTLEIGAATAAALYFLGLFGPMGSLLARIDDLQDAGASLARLTGVIMLPVPDRQTMAIESAVGAPTPGAPTAAVRRGHLEIVDLEFGYRADTTDLVDVALSIAPGEFVAVVGASGAGKSTLARVVAGELVPRRGTVRHDARALAEAHPVDQRAASVLLAQEPHVFDGTVRDDLTLFADADDAAITAAIGRLGAEWILHLPEGLDTRIGDTGLTLTPGQAQHLALVRVALAEAPLVILDEATAEAGSQDAELLDAASRAAAGPRTSVVIAHRLAQTASADRIVVMHDGRIAQTGTHDELRAVPGPYAELWSASQGH
ncbi:ABC transporter ATP-binding protein [Leucobacter japonicus]|uniref:ABC transporter ATP-binding protein n=1 Tax=Leucobacter japonicus TaxID=1461259 RepID=UPI0006A798E4|nr:ABC transporter ATP-binding protein [Leucobacter japonicus]